MRVVKEFIIQHENGLHARPSASISKIANGFKSKINIINEYGEVADGKSILSLMLLAAPKGHKLKVDVEGSDANEAVYVLGNFIENKFGEE